MDEWNALRRRPALASRTSAKPRTSAIAREPAGRTQLDLGLMRSRPFRSSSWPERSAGVMRMIPQLEQLAKEIGAANELGLLAGPDALGRWKELADQMLAESRNEWLDEPAFKQRTGSSARWCRKHFAAYQGVGTARRRGAHRQWHISARPPVAPAASDAEALIDHISASFVQSDK